MMVVYGIKNCDTVKKALSWLNEHAITYEFHDFKKEGVSEEMLRRWASKLGWETLINKRGTTWKRLSEELKCSVTTPEAAYRLLKDNTSIIKRPLLESSETVICGFDEAVYEEKFT